MSFIDAHDFPAGLVLRVLGVAESTYYDRRARQVTPSRRELDDAVYSSRSSRSAPRTSSPPPTARRECGWSCAAKACGLGASGWSGSCGARAAGRSSAPRLA